LAKILQRMDEVKEHTAGFSFLQWNLAFVSMESIGRKNNSKLSLAANR